MDRKTQLAPRSWNTWTGTLEDLRRLFDLVKQLASLRCNTSQAAILPPVTSEDAWEQEANQRVYDRGVAEVALAYETTVRLKTRDETVEGSFEDVIKEFDARTYQTLIIHFRHYSISDKIEVEIWPARRGAERSPGVRVFISGVDRGWALQSQAQLSSEIEKGLPSWRWIYSIFGLPIVSALAFMAVITPFVVKGYLSFQNWTGVVLYVVAVIACGLLSFIGLTPLTQRFIPPVEILVPGQDSSGSRAIGFVISVVIVPFLLSLLLAAIL